MLAIEGLVPLGAAWFVGDAVAARRRYQAGLLEQAAREQAAEAERARQQIREERVRIAQELHDVVAHTLAVITVQAGVGRRLMARRPEEASHALESIEEIGRTAQEELRIVLDLLREEGDSAAELSPAPRLVDLKELVETVRASGTDVELRITSTDRQLSPALELSLYRVVQEALTNVVRHAPGAAATVELAISDDEVRVEVVDNGSPSWRTDGCARVAWPSGSSGCANGSAPSVAPSSPERIPVAGSTSSPKCPSREPRDDEGARRRRRGAAPNGLHLAHRGRGGPPSRGRGRRRQAGGGACGTAVARRRRDGRAHAGDGRHRGDPADHRQRNHRCTPGAHSHDVRSRRVRLRCVASRRQRFRA